MSVIGPLPNSYGAVRLYDDVGAVISYFNRAVSDKDMVITQSTNSDVSLHMKKSNPQEKLTIE